MYDAGDVVIALILGVFFGFVGFIFLDVLLGSTSIAEYPGLHEYVHEQRDDCEARPNVLTCEWDEDKVDYVPSEQAND